MTSWPCSASSAAATDESTPPDIATTILICAAGPHPRRLSRLAHARRGTCRNDPLAVATRTSSWFRGCVLSRGRLSSEAAEFLHKPRQHVDDAIDFLLGRKHPEAEAQRVLCPVRRQTHRAQDVRRFERPRRT